MKIMGIIGAGIAGTGLYFGGISAVLNWGQENNELSQTSQIQLELENPVQNEQPNPERTDETESSQQDVKQEAQSDSNTGSDTQTEKLDFRMETSPQDSLVKIVYWIPETISSDSVFAEIDFFNIQGARAAKPVNKTHAPGSYTAFVSKRGLPDGRYLVRLSATQQSLKEQQEVHHALELVWRYRYQYGGNVQQKMDFKIVSPPQDSIMEIAYWIPETIYSDPVFIELDFFNIHGARVAKPVNKTHAPGSYTAFLPKRGLPDGTYFVRLRANRSEENAERRSLKLIWAYRNQPEPKYPIDLKIESAPQDSLVKIVYSIRETFFSNPVFVEIIFYNKQNMMVARPVSKTHAPGSYTASLSKRGLPDGTYWVKMAVGPDFTLQGSPYSPYAVRRKENLIWADRK